MKEKGHRICRVKENSIAGEVEIEPGDVLLAINGEELEDIFDYQFQTQDSYIEVLIRKPSGEEWLLEIDKEPDEDLGLEFENGLMDEYRSCRNKCIFCFIDQMPAGMRETLYFKDDDSRLSFLQGNYVTLTNMSDRDIDRIIRYRLEPINISFQTTDPALRCKMLHNRFAGEALQKAKRLYEAGIVMNGQIVLCKGVNDGPQLERSIRDLSGYLPHLRSVSVVPVGLSRFREGLYPLEPFGREDAAGVLKLIHAWQDKLYARWGLHFIHASDEWYLLAGRELPQEERYDGYLQLENGVGMLRLLQEEFTDALAQWKGEGAGRSVRERSEEFTDALARWKGKGAGRSVRERSEEFMDTPAQWKGEGAGRGVRDRSEELTDATAQQKSRSAGPEDPETAVHRELSLATGRLAYPVMQRLAREMMQAQPSLILHVYEVRNLFFGERITVSGLLTAQDIIAQLSGRQLGERLLLPVNMLRSGEDVFLDDYRVADVEKALQVRITIVESSGYDLVEAVLGKAEQP